MQVSPRLKREYPNLYDAIYKILGEVPKKPQVWKAFLKYSELNSTQAYTALTTCSATPIIDYRVMPSANGQFSGGTDKNRVYLAKSICEHFKNNSGERNSAKMLLLLESTLLHELVHWGDWKDGKDQAGEEGKAFERAAYGRDINRYW